MMSTHAMPRGLAALIAAGAHIQTKAEPDGLDLITKAIEDNTKAAGDRFAEIEKKAKATDALVFDMAQKMGSRESYGGGIRSQTWGEQFAQSEHLKSFASDFSRPGRIRVEMKNTITSSMGAGGDLATPHRDDMVNLPRRRMTVRDLLPTIKITSGSVEYPKLVGRENNAAPVAEAALKPESGLSFELATLPVRTIAHWIPASRQILDDAPQLAGLIDSELLYGLELKEEAQLLNGDGTGQNLSGLVTNASAFVPPFALATATMIDTVGLAILQNALADLPADGIVMHSSDWMRIRLLKDADGNYILGPPGAQVEPRLFGLPVVATPAMAVDRFLVGNFEAAGTVYDRWEARVEVSTEHADFFTRNLVAILAEERLALAVKQAKALTYGAFGNAE
ncbi:phage major capsid protein [Terrihabitans sp. B22-R8]|uniref:phage major capsid protein n=1 Tax=Terrihabitans sp. B22-R8 TaxID=3425128 RepID=UPI00403CD0D8